MLPSLPLTKFHQLCQVLINTFTTFGGPGLHCLAGKGTIPPVPVPFLTDELANKGSTLLMMRAIFVNARSQSEVLLILCLLSTTLPSCNDITSNNSSTDLQ